MTFLRFYPTEFIGKTIIKMKRVTNIIIFISLIASISLLNSCKDESGFGIFSSQDASTVIMNGVIGSKTPKHWDNYVAAFPNTNHIIMKDCPGSEDDEANLVAARKARQQDVSIHLPADAVIASGAVDFYLAGTSRTREAGSQIGVHSWSDGNNDATAFPVGHENHLPYINYYVEMGFSQTAAEDFYYFTINAASANDIHWMTDAEITQYQLLTP